MNQRLALSRQWPILPLSVVLLLIMVASLLSACSDPQLTDSQQSAVEAKTQTAPFNLAQVKQDYQTTPLTVLDISERERDGRRGLAVMLSVPVDPKSDLQPFFEVKTLQRQKFKTRPVDKTVLPAAIDPVDGAWVVEDNGKTVWFMAIEPNASYEVTVRHGLTAATEAKLLADEVKVIDTADLPAAISFGGDGMFLTKGLVNGLPIEAVNVDSVDIDFFRIDADKMDAFLAHVNLRLYFGRWSIDDISAMGSMVYSGRFDLAAAKNTRVKRNIAIDQISAIKGDGVYLAVMRQAGRYQRLQVAWFTVTDLALHVRYYPNQTEIHVSSVTTGLPVSGVDVTYYGSAQKVLAEGQSGADGSVRFMVRETGQHLIVAQQAGQFSVLHSHHVGLDLSEFDLGMRLQRPIEFFIYSPRDLYRAGEVIEFNGLIRDGDGEATEAIAVRAAIHRPDGSVLSEFVWHPKQDGYYHYGWQIPNDAPVGNWSLVVTDVLEKKQVYPFKVEDFLPERMTLNFNTANDNTVNTDKKTAQLTTPVALAAKEPLVMDVSGAYLYGAPASGNRLGLMVSVAQWRQPVAAFKDFVFGDERQNELLQPTTLADLHLDEQGQAKVTVPSFWQASKVPMKLRLLASLYESGGRPVVRMFDSVVWPQAAMIGIHSHFSRTDKNNPQNNHRSDPNTRVTFDIVKSTLDGTMQNASVLVRLVKEDRQYFWVHNDRSGWHYQWNEKEFVVLSQNMQLDAQQLGQITFPVEQGRYRLEAEDTSTGQVTTYRFYAGEDWYSHWADQLDKTAKPDKLNLILDKASYANGDVAKLTIVAPAASEAMVMVESDRPLWMKRISVAAEGSDIEIPIAADWRQHNIYITVVAVTPAQKRAQITPKRSVGVIHLPLDRQSRRLNVSIDAAEKTRPNQTEMVTVTVTDQQGHVPQGPVYMTLSAVDVGVLSVSRFKTPDPFEYFFGQRRYQVDSRDMYDKLMTINQNSSAQMRFGGDVELARGGEHAAAQVQIVSLFSGLVEVIDGKAQIPLDLPDFNGRLRLMALAFTANSYGSAEKPLTVVAPMVAQLAMPRFLVFGDKSVLSLDINNLSGMAQDIVVKVSTEGMVIDDNAVADTLRPSRWPEGEQRLSLNDGQRKFLTIPIWVNSSQKSAKIQLEIRGVQMDNQPYNIDKQWQLALRPANPAVTRVKAKLLNKGDSFTIDGDDLHGLYPDSAQALLSLSGQASLNISRYWHSLHDYPYGCLEQTGSRAFGVLSVTDQQQRAMGIAVPIEDDRRHLVEKALDRIAGLQKSNGGFGLWTNQDPEEHWLTAYIGDFLLTAQDQGFVVPQGLLTKTMTRLTDYVNRSGGFFNERYTTNGGQYTVSYKAYAAYVLSRLNQAPLGSLRNLYDNQAKTSVGPLPLVHLGLALIKMGDITRGQAALNRGIEQRLVREGYWGDYGSSIRDLALIIRLLIENETLLDPQFVGQAIVISYELAQMVKQWEHLSTQESYAVVMAGTALALKKGDSWLAEVLMNDQVQAVEQTGAYHWRLNEQQVLSSVTLRSVNDKPLYATSTVVGYPQGSLSPVNQGVEIKRSWYGVKGESVSPDNFKVGDLLITRIMMTAKQRTPDALVVDMLPAGFELENQNLDTAIDMDLFRVDGKTYRQLMENSHIKYQEFRDDRYVAALDLRQGQRVELFYLVRVVTPGTYKVPAPMVEDMYQPKIRGVGWTVDTIEIKNH